MMFIELKCTALVRFVSALALCVTAGAAAQSYPSRTIRVLVPFAPGGVLDGLTRPISQRLTELMGQPVVVENRPGGNTAVGTGQCAKGAPDGYTLCVSGSGVLFNPLLYRNLDYSPERDLAAVTNLVLLDGVIVIHASIPAKNLKELIAYARTNPGKLNFGSFGEGSPGHLYLEWVKNRTGVDIAHIPYKGAAPTIQSILANETQIIYMAIGAILPHIKAGKVIPIVLPAANRSRFLTGVPTFIDEGFDFKPNSWFGLFMNAKTPRPMVDRVNSEVRRILADPVFQQKVLTPQFFEAAGSTPEEFAAFLKAERTLAAELVRISGMKPVDM